MRHRIRVSVLAIIAVLLVAGTVLKLIWDARGVQWFTALAVTYAKERLGRDLSIAHLDIRWSLKPVIVLTDVTLGNPPWASRPHLIRIGRAQIEVSLPSLLSRSVRVNRVQLEQVDLLLEMGKGGERNWHFRYHKPLWQRIEALPPVDVRIVTVDDARIGFRDRQGNAHYVTVQQLASDASGAADELNVRFAGIVEGKRVSGAGILGSLSSLRDPDQPYLLDASLHTRNEQARIKGSLKKPLRDLRLDLWATVSGSDLADTVKVFGITTRPLGPFRASGRVVGPPLAPALREIVASVRTSGAEIALRGAVENLRGLDRINVAGSARVTDPHLLGRLFRGMPAPHALVAEGKFSRFGHVYRAERMTLRAGQSVLRGDARLVFMRPRPQLALNMRGSLYLTPPRRHTPLWDMRLPADLLRRLDADVNIDFDQIVITGMPALHQVRAQLLLSDGHGMIAPLSMRFAAEGREVTARLIFQPDPAGIAGIKASMELVAPSLSLPEFLDVVGEPRGIEGGSTTVNIDIEGKGASLRQLLAHMDGEVSVVVGETQLSGRKLDFGADLLTRLFTLAMPSAKSDNTVVQCAVVRLPVDDGVITIDRSVALETTKVTIVASGVIDLRRNRIQVFTRTRASTGLGMGGGVFTDVVQVTGSLDRPRIGISDEGALNAGLSVAGAVATGGFTWLAGGMLNRFFGDRHPCSTALTEK